MLEYLFHLLGAMSAAGSAVVLLTAVFDGLLRKHMRAMAGYLLCLVALAFLLLPVGGLLAPREQPAVMPDAVVTAPIIPDTVSPPPILPEEAPADDYIDPNSFAWVFGPSEYMLLWLGGCAVFLVAYLLRRILCALHLRRLPLLSAPPETLLLLKQAAQRCGLRKPPTCAVYSGVGSPMLVGLFRPRILLPEHYETNDLLPVLTHELVHCRRRDLWVKLLAELARCIHWWNPFSWLLCYEIRRFGELSCDEMVAAGLLEDERKQYGRALLRASECAPKDSRLLGASLRGSVGKHLSKNGRELKRRLERIMNSKKMTRGGIAFLLCAILALGSAGLLVGCSLSPKKPALPTSMGAAELSFAASEIEPQTPAERAIALTEIFRNFVTYDTKTGALGFDVTERIDGRTKRYLQISGRSKMGEGDTTGMSFHLYEAETADDSWQGEPNNHYQTTVDPASLLECELYLAYSDTASGKILAETTVTITPDGIQPVMPPAESNMLWPVSEEGAYISTTYGWSTVDGDPNFHDGMDITFKNDAEGKPIYAAKSGVVSFAGWDGTYGNLVKLSHSDGLETWYAHCRSLEVKQGDSVTLGQEIAKIGNTGRSFAPHLHFEVRKGDERTDPLKYLPALGSSSASAATSSEISTQGDKTPDGNYVKMNGEGYTYIQELYYEAPYIVTLAWSKDAPNEWLDITGTIPLPSGGSIHITDTTKQYADNSAVLGVVEKAVAKAMTRWADKRDMILTLREVTGPYTESVDELAKRFYKEDELVYFSAVTKNNTLSAYTIKELADQFLKDGDVAWFSILSSTMSPAECAVYAKKAYENGDIAIFNIVVDRLSDSEKAAFAKQAANDGETAFFNSIADELSSADAAALAQTAYQNGDIAIFNSIVDDLSDSEKLTFAKQAANDGKIAFFNSVADELSSADAAALAQTAYRNGDIAIFNSIVDGLSSSACYEIGKLACKNGDVAFINSLADALNSTDADKLAQIAYDSDNLACLNSLVDEMSDSGRLALAKQAEKDGETAFYNSLAY